MSRPLRIGFVIAALELAGSERQMLELAMRLPRERFDPAFLLLSRGGANAARAEAAGIPVHVIPPDIRRSQVPPPVAGARLARKALNYVRAVRAGRFDIIDAWLFHAYVLAALTRPLARVPVVVTGRRSLRPSEANGPSGRFLQRIVARRSDAIVANSPQVRDEIVLRERIDPRRVTVIRNGVVIPPLASAAERQARRAELALAPDSFVVGMVANLRPGKGHEVLIRAAAILARQRPQATFVLVGDGPLRARLDGLVHELEIADRVRFVGSVADPPRLLPAFDVFAHPSLAEGMPNAVLEAAAAARPIVATPAGGTREVVRDGQTGLLVPLDDPVTLATALDRLAAEPALRDALGLAARALVVRDFGMDRFVDAFGELYAELAERHGIAA
jgi:glycosyltransferase involved in cell wall biosynthesis